MVARAEFDEIRSIASGSISGSYAAVGSALTKMARAVCITNDTQGSMMFTTDNTKDMIFVKSNSFKLFDLQSNMNAQFDDKYVLPIGTQFYVKQLESPVDGSCYIEYLV